MPGELLGPKLKAGIENVIADRGNRRGAGLHNNSSGFSIGPPQVPIGNMGDDRRWQLLKIAGDAPMGGRYKAFEVKGLASGNSTATGTLTIPETGITVKEDVVYVDNLLEKGLAIHVTSTSGSVFTLAQLAGYITTNIASDTSTNFVQAKLYHAEIPLPLILSCANTASGTNPPVYTPFREGTSTNQPLATLQTPIRLFAANGTNFTITPATFCGYRLSGTGVAMTWANETNSANLCT